MTDDAGYDAPFELPDRMLRVLDRRGNGAWVDPDDEAVIRAAKQRQIDAAIGGAIYDELLTLTLEGGEEWTLPVSHVQEWLVSTHETRAKASALIALIDREYVLARKAAWPDE